MNCLVKIFFIAVFLLRQSFSEAQQNDSLSAYLKYAAENNTGLKSKFLEYSASLEKIPQAASLPDPELQFGFYIQPMEQISGNQIADIKLMQMFPWFGTLKASKDEASKMAVAQLENFQSVRNELFFNIKSQYYSLYLSKKEIQILEKNIKILRTIEQLVLIQYKSNSNSNSISSAGSMNSGTSLTSQNSSSMSGNGMSSNSGANNNSQASSMASPDASMQSGGSNEMVNLFKIQIEINTLENNLALLNDKLNVEKISFNRYLNRKSDMDIFIPDSLAVSGLPANFISLADSIPNNPMVKMFLADSAAYDSRIKMMKRMGYPMLGVGINYSVFAKSANSTSMMNGNDMIMPMITVTLPIYRKKYNSKSHEAELLRDAASFASANAINDIRVTYQQTLKNLNDADRRMVLFSKQSDLAEKSLSLLITSFSANAAGFDEILRMEQQLLDYELKKIEAVTDKNIYINQLLFLTGH